MAIGTFFVVVTAPASPMPFPVGETVCYDIKQLGIHAGEATLVFNGPVEKNNQKVLLITFTAKSLTFFDEEKIYIEPQTYYPLIVERDLNIFGKKEKIVEEYKPGEVKISKEASGKVTEQIIQKSEAIDNIYSFIYRYRTQGTFHQGDKLKMNLPTQDVSLQLLSMKRIKIAGHFYNSFYMEGYPKKVRVWFDEGAQKLPLRIDGALGVGSMSMVMKSYK